MYMSPFRSGPRRCQGNILHLFAPGPSANSPDGTRVRACRSLRTGVYSDPWLPPSSQRTMVWAGASWLALYGTVGFATTQTAEAAATQSHPASDAPRLEEAPPLNLLSKLDHFAVAMHSTAREEFGANDAAFDEALRHAWGVAGKNQNQESNEQIHATHLSNSSHSHLSATAALPIAPAPLSHLPIPLPSLFQRSTPPPRRPTSRVATTPRLTLRPSGCSTRAQASPTSAPSSRRERSAPAASCCTARCPRPAPSAPSSRILTPACSGSWSRCRPSSS